MRASRVLPIAAVVLASGFAYWLQRSRAPSPAAAPALEARVPRQPDPPAPPATEPGGRASPARVAELERHFDEVVREKGDPRVVRRLQPRTELGRKLCRLAMSIRLGPELSGGEMKLLGQEYLREFAQAREETLREARAAIGDLPGSEFAQERMGVYATLSRLPGPSADLRELTLQELTQRAPPARPTPEEAGDDPQAKAQAMSFGMAQGLVLYTYRMFLDSGPDAEQALGGTLQALESQPDAGVRQFLATAFVSRFPDMKSLLYQRLGGVELPDVQAQPRAGAPRSSVPPGVIATQ